jgi:hypothetical protein
MVWAFGHGSAPDPLTLERTPLNFTAFPTLRASSSYTPALPPHLAFQRTQIPRGCGTQAPRKSPPRTIPWTYLASRLAEFAGAGGARWQEPHDRSCATPGQTGTGGVAAAAAPSGGAGTLAGSWEREAGAEPGRTRPSGWSPAKPSALVANPTAQRRAGRPV